MSILPLYVDIKAYLNKYKLRVKNQKIDLGVSELQS